MVALSSTRTVPLLGTCIARSSREARLSLGLPLRMLSGLVACAWSWPSIEAWILAENRLRAHFFRLRKSLEIDKLPFHVGRATTDVGWLCARVYK